MSIVYANDLTVDLQAEALVNAIRKLHNLYTTYKGLSNRPVLQSRAYETYITVRQILHPFFQHLWVGSYEFGTDNIPGIDERDINDVVMSLAERYPWKDITVRRIRHELAASLMSRRYFVPWFNGLPCTAKGCYRGIRENEDGNEVKCAHCDGRGVEPNPLTGKHVGII